MSKFIIQPHGRLQEWIAHEKGYFTDEGLDYEIPERDVSQRVKKVDENTGEVAEIKSGAYEAYIRGGGNKGAKSDISCACHWAINQAAANNVGKMWGKSYVVTPGAVMVREDSDIKKPEDLAGREVAVGYHSGSHFSTIQALEPFLKSEDIKLKFIGLPWQRVDAGLDRDVDATSVWGITYQACEQLGMRRIADTSFMIGFMFPDGVDEGDVEKYMNGLKRAQMDLDLEPENYKHLYLKAIPDRYKSNLDVRLFSSGERIVFLPYSESTFAKTQDWIKERNIFDEMPESYRYETAVSA
ncbi:MAG TPA: ABC transporter substrate-binding protein [Rhodospirillales bacterium]|nr:ABC transporter substrate-binding protein [Rhodospirillales bacterium]HIA81281.1 ABC transporter substrate-binding protein [Rhodospirillales bacterium]HIB20362.1 ABC transporter substrate-binding protein [Rhodospirillales bacterium]HIP08655.1 ABC transporter substrate-binding protein [Rhodospirillales bacterium]